MSTRILTSNVLAVINNAELTITEKKSWLRCEANKDRRLYVPKGAKTIGRIDLSGFEVPSGEAGLYGVNPLGDKSFGGVKSQLSFEGTEEEILTNLASVIEFMKSLPGHVKVVKVKPAEKTSTEEIVTPASTVDQVSEPTFVEVTFPHVDEMPFATADEE